MNMRKQEGAILRAKNIAGDTALEGVENYILTKVEAFESQVVSERME